MKNKNSETGVSNIEQLTDDLRTDIDQRIRRSLGLTPFYDISDLPKDSEWLPVEDHPEAAEGFKVYDLKWTDKTNLSYVLKKWQFFIDTQTFLPTKIKVYSTERGQDQYNLEMVMLAEQKSDSEIRKDIQDAGFEF